MNDLMNKLNVIFLLTANNINSPSSLSCQTGAYLIFMG